MDDIFDVKESAIVLAVSNDFGMTWKRASVGLEEINVLALRRTGLSLSEISEVVGRTKGVIHNIVNNVSPLNTTLERFGISSGDMGDFMNEARLNSLINGLSSLAKRVYEAVPTDVAVSVNEVLSVMNRLNGIRYDLNKVQGCLDSLRSSGLLQEKPGRLYIKIARRESAMSQALVAATADLIGKQETKETVVQAKPEVNPEVKKPEPIDRMAALAKRIRDVSAEIAAEMEDIALQVETAKVKQEGDLSKLRQLQALLKGIGD